VESQSDFGLKDLAEHEQVALAALLRLLVRLDGEFSAGEQAAVEEIALDFGEKRFWKLMDDAAQMAPDEQGIRSMALRVVRPSARELIYGLLLGVAQSDVIQGRESSLLDWLRAEWKLDELPEPYRG
jgi:uncharacterized tellurite resistance protein B-like protein